MPSKLPSFLQYSTLPWLLQMAIEEAPRKLQSWMRLVPTPEAAAWIRTVSSS